MKKILLADDNPDLCSALALLLKTRAQMEIVGQVCQRRDIFSQTAACQPEIIILDWVLAAVDCLDCLQELRRLAPGCKIIITSVRPEDAATALAAGADGFVCKIYPPETLLDVIERNG